jgi:hypothetical protein
MEIANVWRPSALDAWQPAKEALITCFIFDKTMDKAKWLSMRGSESIAIQSRYSEDLVEVWRPRTYHVWKDNVGWRLDVGEKCLFTFESWAHFVRWFEKMAPIHIEILTDI